mmetsp:Transcript_27823/g.67362  ORF Transcript_27823/g.67362 Transcript_27823/m.67362 type:complete len:426 (-) Transcript_27823:6399-7676(-)|eukprot:CAMPEP_0113447746 /NCGR_PEP_ID=MMETSP0014_2-20120614/4398_1 /TAXON_ID=2857 /ORGANISM="Nitzschia sp." /LENGTH=425 /DNA_ID=CAMNT_0000338913 /DNA_START=58 /DNA_END=1335 /DNA_ORIENTATION=- /assembly_acc=CAM_ASM_000159
MNNNRNKHPRTETDGDERDDGSSKKPRPVAGGEASSYDDISPDQVSSSTSTPAPAASAPSPSPATTGGNSDIDFHFDDEDDNMTEAAEFTSEREERLVKNLAKLTLGVLSKDETIKFLKSIYSWITSTEADDAKKFQNKQRYITSFGKGGGFFQVFLYMKNHLNDDELLRAAVDVLSLFVASKEQVSKNSTKALLNNFDQLKVLLDANSKVSTIMGGDNNDDGSTTGGGSSSYEIPPSSFVVLRRIWYLIYRYVACSPASTPAGRSGCKEVINACLDLLDKLPVQDPDRGLVRNVRNCILTYLDVDNVGLNGMLVDIGTRYLEFATKHCDQADFEVLSQVIRGPSLNAFGGIDFGRTKLLPYCIKVITHHKSCPNHAICLIKKVLNVVSKKEVQKTGIVAALATTLESDDQQPSRDVTNLIKKLL